MAVAFKKDPPDLWDNTGMLGSVCIIHVAFISQLPDLLGPPYSHQPTEKVLDPALVNTFVSPTFESSECFSKQGNQMSLFISVVFLDVSVLSGPRMLVQKGDLFCL